jgi:hypothetical protein
LAPFDPWQIKGGLKFIGCPDYVFNVTGTSDGTIMFNAVDKLIEAGKMFETDSPPGAELGGPDFVIMSLSIPLTVDLRPPAPVVPPGGGVGVPTGPGRVIKIFATDNTLNWNLSIDGGDALVLEPGTKASVQDGSVGTIDVSAGDSLVFVVETGNTGHGVMFASAGGMHMGTAEQEVAEIFSVDASNSAPLATSSDFKFVDLFGVEGYGAAISAVGPNKILFSATVKPGAAGKSLLFTCFVHGTATMNGRIRVVG